MKDEAASLQVWVLNKIAGMMNNYTLANLAAATAALSAGASVVATRLVIGETDPVTLAFYRYVIATCCLAPVLFVQWPRSGSLARPWNHRVSGRIVLRFIPLDI